MRCCVNNSNRRSLRFAGSAATRTYCGFTLLELMIVITMLMILMAIAVPVYQQHIIQAREAVLHENLHTINKVIQEFTLDKGQAPQSLDDLKTYLHEIPKDPMTGQADWEPEQEDPQTAADPNQPGIVRVHSHSQGTTSSGEAYSSW